jgi:hypothetical protein
MYGAPVVVPALDAALDFSVVLALTDELLELYLEVLVDSLPSFSVG